jgi:hypothetical protein
LLFRNSFGGGGAGRFGTGRGGLGSSTDWIPNSTAALEGLLFLGGSEALAPDTITPPGGIMIIIRRGQLTNNFQTRILSVENWERNWVFSFMLTIINSP